MLSRDPFGLVRDANSFREEVQKHLSSTDEQNKTFSVFKQISLCNTIISLTPNLNHSSYLAGYIYDSLNSIVAIIEKRERYLQLNFRSMVEHIARISLNKINNGGDFDQTVRRKDFDFLKSNVLDENWHYLHDVYINACHYVHSSPKAKLNFTARFRALMNEDCNSTQHKMVIKLASVTHELMKVIIKHYHNEISNVFFRNKKDLEKVLGKSLYAYYLTFE